jgi:hypothetical protein
MNIALWIIPVLLAITFVVSAGNLLNTFASRALVLEI